MRQLYRVFRKRKDGTLAFVFNVIAHSPGQALTRAKVRVLYRLILGERPVIGPLVVFVNPQILPLKPRRRYHAKAQTPPKV